MAETHAPAAEPLPFLLQPGGLRAIQLQVTRRCNLQCSHCYSESGPDRTGALRLPEALRFLGEALALGYRYVGVSGGEPLLWPGLAPLLRGALELGFTTSVVTNGTLLTEAKAAELRSLARTVAVSVDGPPEDHNALRGSPRAFDWMLRGLGCLRAAGMPFTLAFTLTRHNVDRLSWLHRFAEEVGAARIEVHALAAVGAAGGRLSDAVPRSIDLQVAAWLLALLAERRRGEGPEIFLDAVALGSVDRSGWPLLDDERRRSAAFSDLVPAVVVGPDGAITPFVYGLPPALDIGRLGGGSLHSLTEAWRERCGLPAADLVRRALERLRSAGASYLDLFSEVIATALAPR